MFGDEECLLEINRLSSAQVISNRARIFVISKKDFI